MLEILHYYMVSCYVKICLHFYHLGNWVSFEFSERLSKGKCTSAFLLILGSRRHPSMGTFDKVLKKSLEDYKLWCCGRYFISVCISSQYIIFDENIRSALKRMFIFCPICTLV